MKRRKKELLKIDLCNFIGDVLTVIIGVATFYIILLVTHFI